MNANIPIFTRPQVAKLTGISYTTLVRWDDEGKMVAFRSPGNHALYTAAQIDKLQVWKDAVAKAQRICDTL